MSYLMGTPDLESDNRGAKELVVEGKTYRNAAAKFWSTLLDDVMAEFPACNIVRLSAVTEGVPDKRWLFPDWLRDLDKMIMSAKSIQKEMQNIIAEVEIVGLPTPVKLDLLALDDLKVSRELPGDCMDSETFLYFAAWLLEWCGIDEQMLQAGHAEGTLQASDEKRQVSYKAQISLSVTPLAEGLYRVEVCAGLDLQK